MSTQLEENVFAKCVYVPWIMTGRACYNESKHAWSSIRRIKPCQSINSYFWEKGYELWSRLEEIVFPHAVMLYTCKFKINKSVVNVIARIHLWPIKYHPLQHRIDYYALSTKGMGGLMTIDEMRKHESFRASLGLPPWRSVTHALGLTQFSGNRALDESRRPGHLIRCMEISPRYFWQQREFPLIGDYWWRQVLYPLTRRHLPGFLVCYW